MITHRLVIATFCLTQIFVCLGLIGPIACSFGEDANSDQREQQILASLELVEQDFSKVADDVDKLVRVDFRLQHSLLAPEEDAVLVIVAKSATPPNSELQVLDGCYGESPEVFSFDLDWKKGTAPDEYQAVWKWRPPHVGNYLLRWECDCGGDVPVFTRNLSVVDGTYAVVILNSTSHALPRPEPDFHELHLPFSYWAESSLFGRRATAEQFVQFSRNARQFGDDAGLMVFMGGDYFPDDKTIFYDETEAVQRAVLQGYQKLWSMHGFPRPLRSLYTYGMGNVPVRVARSLGFDLLGSLCADQNWGDGPFKINHWGMPSRPYFVSQEDFRKPANGDAEAMVGVQQCMRHSMGCRDYNCVYSFESGIAYAFDKYRGKSGERFAPEVILSRELDFFECLLAGAGKSETPSFFCCGFEMNGVWPHMAAINRQMMEYFADRAQDAPIAYTNAAAAADYYRRHVRRLPESILYLPDVFAGLTQGKKPANYPDVMEIENHKLRAIFRSGETLPHALYDYTIPWSFADWGNAEIPRKPDGYVVPNTEDRFGITPSCVDTRGIAIKKQVQEVSSGTQITWDIEAGSSFQGMVLAVWDLPHDYSQDDDAYRLEGVKRFVPVRAPFTDNLNGILVVDLQPGKNRIVLTVTTARRAVRTLDISFGDRVMAKVIKRDGQSTAYLFSTSDVQETVDLTIPDDLSPQLYPNNFDEASELQGDATITIEPGECVRVVGMDFDELLGASAVAKPVFRWTMVEADAK